MMRSSGKLVFAIEAVLDIAYHAGDQPVQSAEITRRLGIPPRYLEPVLQNLVRAGLLAGTRGPRGGYRLARERRRITVADIVRTVHGAEPTTAGGDWTPSSDLGRRVVEPFWSTLHDEYMGRLEATTIDELCRRAQDKGIARDFGTITDFSI